MTGLLVITNILLILLLLVLVGYLYKFVKIIFIIEDLLTASIEVFEETDKSIKELEKLEMFFDSPEVKISLQKVMENIKLSRLELSNIINNFTNISKQKYVLTITSEENDEDEN